MLAHVQHRHEQTLNSADGILWFGCLAFAATGSGMAIILGNVQQRSEELCAALQCRWRVRQVQAQLLLIYQQFHTSVSNKLVTRAWSIAVVYCFCRVLLGRCSSTDRSTLLSLHDTMRRHKQTCQAIKSGAVDMRADGDRNLNTLVWCLDAT